MKTGFNVIITPLPCKAGRGEGRETLSLLAELSHTNAVFQRGKGGFCGRFHAAVGIGRIAERDVFCCALFDQVLNPCDQ